MIRGFRLLALLLAAGPALAADPPAQAPPAPPAPVGRDLCYAGATQVYSPGARMCQAGKLMECDKGSWRMARTSMLGNQTENPCSQGVKLPFG